MAKTVNVVTEEHAREFEQYVSHWQVVLGMPDWRIVRKAQRCASYMAIVDKIEPEHRLASYRVGKNFGGCPVTSYTLSRTALHEVLHIFLYGLIHAVVSHGKESDDCLAEEHRIIHILEPLLCPPENSDANASEDT